MSVAVVDCGTNSTRLLVAAREASRVEPLVRDQAVTRLGAQVSSAGGLDDAAIERTVDVVEQFAATWRRHDVQAVRIVGTSALRDAADRQRFLDAVHDRVGVRPEVLTGAQEASWTFHGAVEAVDAARPALVVDIGGGSTELIVGDHAPSAATTSQLGSVRLTERALSGDPPDAAQIATAQAEVAAEVDATRAVIAPHHPRSMVAVAGTATTLAALHLGMDAYDTRRIHGTVIPGPDVQALAARLLRMPAAQIGALGPVAPGREDVLAAGALVLARLLEAYGMSHVVVSEADLLDGLARSLLGL